MSWILRSFRKKKDKNKKDKNKNGIEHDQNERRTKDEPSSSRLTTSLNTVDTAGLNQQQPKVTKITEFADAFLNYEPNQPGSLHGKGLCVVFSLFTEDLQGYKQDVNAIHDFFGQLEYEVWCKNGFENLTREELFQKIMEMRTYIRNNSIDRLFVVILTHGNEEGLLTCKDKDGVLREQVTIAHEESNGKAFLITQTVVTKVEEIVDCFKHDTVSSLKDVPKLFLIQACRGAETVKAANKPHVPSVEVSEDEVDASALQFNPVSPIDADIMICYASIDNHTSLVHPNTGSWFIQQTIEVFKRHYKTQHVADMMTVVKLTVAELRGTILNEDGSCKTAIQLPCVFSTFRRRFYLYNQPQKYILSIDRSRYFRHS